MKKEFDTFQEHTEQLKKKSEGTMLFLTPRSEQ